MNHPGVEVHDRGLLIGDNFEERAAEELSSWTDLTSGEVVHGPGSWHGHLGLGGEENELSSGDIISHHELTIQVGCHIDIRLRVGERRRSGANIRGDQPRIGARGRGRTAVETQRA